MNFLQSLLAGFSYDFQSPWQLWLSDMEVPQSTNLNGCSASVKIESNINTMLLSSLKREYVKSQNMLPSSRLRQCRKIRTQVIRSNLDLFRSFFSSGDFCTSLIIRRVCSDSSGEFYPVSGHRLRNIVSSGG